MSHLEGPARNWPAWVRKYVRPRRPWPYLAAIVVIVAGVAWLTIR